MKIITIDDFSGGRTNFLDQPTIPQNMCTSASQNVWAAENGLTKTPGMVELISLTASAGATGGGAIPWTYYDDTVAGGLGYRIYYRINYTATGGNNSKYNLFADRLPLGEAPAAPGYTVGTVSISGGARTSATGNGTGWSTNVTAGDAVILNSHSGGLYTVASVEDDTHLTLNTGPSSNVATGTTYVIQPGLTYKEAACCVLAGSLITCTTADAMQQYAGGPMTRIAAAPTVAYLQTFKGYAFAARAATATSRVYWSAINNTLSWPVNNFVDVDQTSNGPITGLFVYGPELIVFKARGMYKIIGDVFDPTAPSYYVIQIQTPPDFLFNSSTSCALHNGMLTFYGMGRIYQYKSGTTFITDISPSIIRDLPSAFGTFPDAHNNPDQQVHGIEFNGFYILNGLADPNNAGRHMCLLLDRKNVWWYMSNSIGSNDNDIFGPGRTMFITPSTTARPALNVALGTTSGKVFTWDFIGPTYGANYIDNTVSPIATANIGINGVWKSKEFNIDYGTFKFLAVYLKKQSAGNLTVQWSIDQQTAVSQTIDMTSGRGNIIRAVLPISQKGSTIQITLSNNVAGQTFKVYAVKVFYEDSPFEMIR